MALSSITGISTDHLISTISIEQLQALMPNADNGKLNNFLPMFNKYLPQFYITMPLRLACFLATGAEESGELCELEENLYYTTPARLMKVWPAHFPSTDFAAQYIRDPEKLGNYIYGTGHLAAELGNTQPGDGFAFRGRGWFNGTGREFYQKMATFAGIDFINQPALMAEPEYAVLGACKEWDSLKLNDVADTGNFYKVTKLINGGYENMSDRLAYYAKAKQIFEVA